VALEGGFKADGDGVLIRSGAVSLILIFVTPPGFGFPLRWIRAVR
jgi:hypothetical protein